jgi:dTDP-4-amino-4,6-dideoxygalactose transaminase
MSNFIPFNKPNFRGNELEYIERAIESGRVSGNGAYTERCQERIEELLGVPKVLLTTSCTHALEMAGILINCGPGDEVIVPSFTFVSTVLAFVTRGATPVFADVRPDTLNIDETQLESLITERTKAIVVVHYAGVSCEMDVVLAIAARHNLPVVEDNAHGLLGRYRGRMLGTMGCLATQSFHETKNVTCGEGGALVINDERYTERAQVIWEKGTNRSRFFRGEVDRYTWVDVGSSYLPSDILAAFLFAQLENIFEIQGARQRIWERYRERLADWAAMSGVQFGTVPDYCDQAYHMFYMLMPDEAQRDAIIRHLGEHRIKAVFHYLPLHLSDMGLRYGGQEGQCPVTEGICDRLVRLPFYNDLSESDQDRVIEAVQAFR